MYESLKMLKIVVNVVNELKQTTFSNHWITEYLNFAWIYFQIIFYTKSFQ